PAAAKGIALNKINVQGLFRWLRFAPRSLRWRLQLWQGFLVVTMMAGFGITIYQFQSANRTRQIDGELEKRVTALSLAVRGVYRETPPGTLHTPTGFDTMGPGPPPPPDGEKDGFHPSPKEKRPYSAAAAPKGKRVEDSGQQSPMQDIGSAAVLEDGSD